MDERAGAIAAIALLFLAGMAQGGDSNASSQPDRSAVADLVRKLGDSSFQVRDDAQKELIRIGAPAIPELEKAARGGDAEVRLRSAAGILRCLPSSTRA